MATCSVEALGYRRESAGYLDEKHILTHTLRSTVSGRVGISSKADSVVYFDDYTIRPVP